MCTRLTYICKGRDVRNMTHIIDGVKNKNKGGGGLREKREREKRVETDLEINEKLHN